MILCVVECMFFAVSRCSFLRFVVYTCVVLLYGVAVWCSVFLIVVVCCCCLHCDSCLSFVIFCLLLFVICFSIMFVAVTFICVM